MKKIDVLIQRMGQPDKGQYPVVTDNSMIEWHRKGAPGKFTFTVVKDDVLSFREGDAVKVQLDGKDIFFGFVFTKTRNSKDPELIKVTAYDQLRYLKNKTSIHYKAKTAGEVVSMLADDFKLKKGEIANTEHVIAERTEESSTLFDIIQNAVDETVLGKKKLYVLYDDVGKIALKSAEDMRLGLLISVDTAGGYEYSSSIDKQTYNQVKVTYEDKESGKREVYMAKSTESINQWGLLQLNEKVDNATNGRLKAETLLSLHNSIFRTLTVKDAIGDIRVRAGSSVVVQLDLGDVNLQRMMLVEAVTHKFKDDAHTMDLKLRGGTFVV